MFGSESLYFNSKSNHQTFVLTFQIWAELALGIANQARLIESKLIEIVSQICRLFSGNVLTNNNSSLIKRHRSKRLLRVFFIDHGQSEIESALLTPQSPVNDYDCDVHHTLFQWVFDQCPFIYVKINLQNKAYNCLIYQQPTEQKYNRTQ